MNRLLFPVCLGAVLLLAVAALSEETRLETGFYVIRAEAASASELGPIDESHRVVIYDYRFLRCKKPAPKHLLVRAAADVPLSLARKPRLFTSENGLPALDFELTKASARALEETTAAHVGGVVAFIVDGEVVSTHKIREKITGGSFKLTRCTDHACRYIYGKLKVE